MEREGGKGREGELSRQGYALVHKINREGISVKQGDDSGLCEYKT